MADRPQAGMFQDFENPSDDGATVERVKRLRAAMAERGIDAFLVPRADQHQGEYVPRNAERLSWITGFTGSAGMAVIAKRTAVLFVDGRYTVQVRGQVDAAVFEIRQAPEQKLSDWLCEKLPTGSTIGFDPWLHTWAEIERLGAAVKPHKLQLKPLPVNPLDRTWGAERPAEPLGAVIVHPLQYAGTAAGDKLATVQKRLKDEGQSAVVLTLPDSICWLLNIRGSDVAHNPVALAFAIVHAKGKAELFIDRAKVSAEVANHLAPTARLFPPKEFAARLKLLTSAKSKTRLDADTAAFAIARALGNSNIARGRDPCIEPKAKKCAAEIKGARAAHVRDGAAVVRFLSWLDAEAETGGIDEITAVRQLEDFRRASPLLRDISFDTISGSGPNGAIVHYRVTQATNRCLQPGELFLIDSGAQYADGTTDITRTIAIGQPSQAMRTRYTAVLKGHIAIATARFPTGTRGVDIDGLARHALWQLGLDYDHGTGHGVGSYLSVHEGPASISKRGMVPLEPGMILSNEPGYYATGSYGIRIENLVLVETATVPKGGERAMLSFETLTLAPYDRRLIDIGQLTSSQWQWIDAYHARVRAEIGPLLERQDRTWLDKATAPLEP